MQVVDECTPGRIGVEHNVHEANRVIHVLRKQGECTGRAVEAFGPYSQTIGVKVTIKVVVRVRASVVATPTVRMKLRDGWCVGGVAQPYLDT